MLNPDEIKRFDNMSNDKFVEVCKFHENLSWMIPVGLFCLFLKDGWFGILCLVLYGIWGFYTEIKAEEYYNTIITERRKKFFETGEMPKKGEE